MQKNKLPVTKKNENENKNKRPLCTLYGFSHGVIKFKGSTSR